MQHEGSRLIVDEYKSRNCQLDQNHCNTEALRREMSRKLPIFSHVLQVRVSTKSTIAIPSERVSALIQSTSSGYRKTVAHSADVSVDWVVTQRVLQM